VNLCLLWTSVYYVNTSEIPSEISLKNFISSHVKITCYLHTWEDHRRYGYIMNRALESKLTCYFTGVSIITTRYRVDYSSEISSWPIENKIHILARACNILYVIMRNDTIVVKIYLTLIFHGINRHETCTPSLENILYIVCIVYAYTASF